MNLLHSFPCLFHSRQGLSVDIGRFDGVYLLLERRYLCRCLLESMLVLLLSFESGSRG
jgi:hypothetical protein